MERPLGRSERVIFHLDRVSSLNFATVGRVRGPLTLAKLESALNAAAKRHPFLAARVVPDAKGVLWLREGPLPSVRLVKGAEWIADAEREVNEPIAADTGPLVRCVLVEHAADDHTLILNFHHSVGDGFSGVFLLRDLVQAASGEILEPLPTPTGGPMDARFPEPGRGLAGLWAFLGFALGELWLTLRHGPATSVRRESPALAHQRRSRVIPRVLEPGLASRLAERARAERTTVHGALSAAILLATVADTEQGRADKPVRVGFGAPVDLRKKMSPPVGEDLGFFVSMLAWGGRVRRSEDFWTLARTIRASTVASQARGATWAALRALDWAFRLLGGARLPPHEMGARWERSVPATTGLTNLGRLGIATRFGELEITEAHFLTCPGSLGVWLSTATSLNGKLFWNFVYTDPVLSSDHAHALAADAVARLERAVDGDLAADAPAPPVRVVG